MPAIFAMAVLLYAGTFGHGFNMDDLLVTDGHRFTSKGFAGIKDIITSPYYEDEMGYSYEYRPVTHLSFAMQHQLLGSSARAGHVLNVAIYAITCVLVFQIGRTLMPLSGIFPLAATLLFLLHPMHTEPVASIKNRDELLALLFVLFALREGIKATETQSMIPWILTPLFIVLSLLSKASALSFLVLIPLGTVTVASTAWKRTLGLAMLCALIGCSYVMLMNYPDFMILSAGLTTLGLPMLPHIYRWIIKLLTQSRVTSNTPSWASCLSVSKLKSRWDNMHSMEAWADEHRFDFSSKVVLCTRNDLLLMLITAALIAMGTWSGLWSPAALMFLFLLTMPIFTASFRPVPFLIAALLGFLFPMISTLGTFIGCNTLLQIYIPVLFTSCGWRLDWRFVVLAVIGLLPTVPTDIQNVLNQGAEADFGTAFSGLVGPMVILCLSLVRNKPLNIIALGLWAGNTFVHFSNYWQETRDSEIFMAGVANLIGLVHFGSITLKFKRKATFQALIVGVMASVFTVNLGH